MPCPFATSPLLLDYLAMAASTVGVLTAKEDPDFFTALTLPVCCLLVPVFKVLLHRAFHWIYKGVIGS